MILNDITLVIKHLKLLNNQHLFKFQIILNAINIINTGTYYITIYPQNFPLSIKDVFITYMDKLIEHNENLETPFFLLT